MAESFLWIRTATRWWRCIGNIASTIWSSGTMRFTGCRCRISYLMSALIPTIATWQVGHESKDAHKMGPNDIGVTLKTYTHLGLEDVADELERMKDLDVARKGMEKTKPGKSVSQKMFRSI